MKTILRSATGAIGLVLVAAVLGVGWNLVNPNAIALTLGDEAPARTTPDSPEARAARIPFSMAAKLPADDQISIAEAAKLFDESPVFFVDARDRDAYDAVRIPGARWIHEKQFAELATPLIEQFRLVAPEDAKDYPDGYPVVTYCDNHTCDMASIVMTKLRDCGVANVRCLVMGLDEWIAANHLVTVPEGDKRVEKRGPAIRASATDTGVGIGGRPWLAILIVAPFLLAFVLHRLLPPDTVQTIGFVGRIALGLVFVVAAGFKLWDPAEFAGMVACYDIVPSAWLPVFAVTLPAVELVAAAALIGGVCVRPAALVMIAMLIGFMVAIYSLLDRGLSCSCGCFPIAYPASWIRIYEDGAMLLAAALAWSTGRKPSS